MRKILAQTQSSTRNTHAAPAQSSITPSGGDPSGANGNGPAPQAAKPKCKHRHLPVRFPIDIIFVISKAHQTCVGSPLLRA